MVIKFMCLSKFVLLCLLVFVSVTNVQAADDEYFSIAVSSDAHPGGKCLGTDSNGTSVGVQVCDGSDGQLFKWNDDVALQHKASERCLDIRNGSSANGADIILLDCHTGSNQDWHYDNSAHHLVSNVVQSGNFTLCVTAGNIGSIPEVGDNVLSHACDTSTSQENQYLSLSSFTSAPDRYFSLHLKADESQCLTVRSVASCDGRDTQLYRFTKEGKLQNKGWGSCYHGSGSFNDVIFSTTNCSSYMAEEVTLTSDQQLKLASGFTWGEGCVDASKHDDLHISVCDAQDNNQRWAVRIEPPFMEACKPQHYTGSRPLLPTNWSAAAILEDIAANNLQAAILEMDHAYPSTTNPTHRALRVTRYNAEAPSGLPEQSDKLYLQEIGGSPLQTKVYTLGKDSSTGIVNSCSLSETQSNKGLPSPDIVGEGAKAGFESQPGATPEFQCITEAPLAATSRPVKTQWWKKKGKVPVGTKWPTDWFWFDIDDAHTQLPYGKLWRTMIHSDASSGYAFWSEYSTIYYPKFEPNQNGQELFEITKLCLNNTPVTMPPKNQRHELLTWLDGAIDPVPSRDPDPVPNGGNGGNAFDFSVPSGQKITTVQVRAVPNGYLSLRFKHKNAQGIESTSTTYGTYPNTTSSWTDIPMHNIHKVTYYSTGTYVDRIEFYDADNNLIHSEGQTGSNQTATEHIIVGDIIGATGSYSRWLEKLAFKTQVNMEWPKQWALGTWFVPVNYATPLFPATVHYDASIPTEPHMNSRLFASDGTSSDARLLGAWGYDIETDSAGNVTSCGHQQLPGAIDRNWGYLAGCRARAVVNPKFELGLKDQATIFTCPIANQWFWIWYVIDDNGNQTPVSFMEAGADITDGTGLALADYTVKLPNALGIGEFLETNKLPTECTAPETQPPAGTVYPPACNSCHQPTH